VLYHDKFYHDVALIVFCSDNPLLETVTWYLSLAAKLVPVGYGIKKLQISCVVEDDKVSMDDVEEQILAHEDFIQSMDIVVFNKI